MRFLLRLWIISAAVLCCGLSAAEKAGTLYELRVDKKPFFYAEILPSGEAFKAYPKPRVPIGTFDGETLVFTPAKSVHSADDYYPLVANIVAPSALDDKGREILTTLLFESEAKTVDLKAKSWTGPKVELDWKMLELAEVSKEDRAKIEAFEKALLGKWKFVKATDKLGDATKDATQYKSVEFCANGECIADGEKKFYWVDGKFLRLSFQTSQDWREYSMTEEYDIERPDQDKIVIRSLAIDPNIPPSRYKVKEVDESYPENPLKWEFHFERVSE